MQKSPVLGEEITMLNEEDSDLHFSENSRPTECNATTLRTLRRMRIQRSEPAESPSFASNRVEERHPEEQNGGEKSKRLQKHLSLLSVQVENQY